MRANPYPHRFFIRPPRPAGEFQGKTSDVDKRHGDPEYGGLTSGEKAALSRGQTPKGVSEDPEKAAGAERYMKEHHKKGGA
jgi:hypothetical protein